MGPVPGQQLVAVEQRHGHRHLLGSQVQTQAGPVGQRLSGRGQQPQPGVHHVAGAQFPRVAHRVAPMQVAQLQGTDVQRHPLPGRGPINQPAVHLDASHLATPAAHLHLYLVILAHRAGHHGAGDHGTESLHGKHPVHRQAKGSLGAALF